MSWCNCYSCPVVSVYTCFVRAGRLLLGCMCHLSWTRSQQNVSFMCVIRLRGDEGVLLACDRCDKAYHTQCLSPPLDHAPGTSWTCKVRTSMPTCTHLHTHRCVSADLINPFRCRTVEFVVAAVWCHQASGPIIRFCASHVTLPCPALSVTTPPTSTHHRSISPVPAAIGTNINLSSVSCNWFTSKALHQREPVLLLLRFSLFIGNYIEILTWETPDRLRKQDSHQTM